jgi:hypothetical protein
LKIAMPVTCMPIINVYEMHALGNIRWVAMHCKWSLPSNDWEQSRISLRKEPGTGFDIPKFVVSFPVDNVTN